MSMLTKISHTLLAVCFSLICMTAHTLTAQAQCPAPTNLVKGPATATSVSFSWTAAPGALHYEVDYITPSDTLHAVVAGPQVNFPMPADTSFQIISVISVCPHGGTGGPLHEAHGGIVITIADIFGPGFDCDSLRNTGASWVFIEQICKYVRVDDMCDLLYALGPKDAYGSLEVWEDAFLREVNERGEHRGFAPWAHGHGCGNQGSSDPAHRIAQISPLRVAPNPFQGGCTVTFEAVSGSACTVTLSDMTGRIVESYHHASLPAGHFTQKHIGRTLPAGIYTLQVIQGTAQQHTRIIKQ